MSDRRFVILDPCLESAGSHPLHFAAEVFRAAATAGFGCRLVANRRFATGAAPPEWNASAAFTNTAYSKYNAFGGLDRLDARGRPPLLPPSPWAGIHARRRREQRISAFARDVGPALAGLRTGDIVLLATASELEVAGLARAIAATALPRGIGWHVLFHFPLCVGFGPDFTRQQQRLLPVAALLRQAIAIAAPHTLNWHATTEELAAHYARLGAGPVDAVPYPIPMPPPVTRSPHGSELRIACLGDARPEKGTQHLADAIEAVVSNSSREHAVTFAVQSNLGFRSDSRARGHRAVCGSLARLAALARAGAPVELLAGPLDPDAYARALAATDALLLPYDQSRYRPRCSGVILEALAAGRVPIVTGGGWMARQLAGPHQRHVAAVVARCEALDAARLAPGSLAAARPLVMPLVPPAARPGCAALAAAVEVSWGPDGAWIDEPPVRIAIEQGRQRYATTLAATPERRAQALLPCEPGGGPVRLTCAPGVGAPRVGIDTVRVRWLRAAEPQPLSAVGIVIDSAADIPAAIRELLCHRDHYRDTAARHAPLVRAASSATAFLHRLLAAPGHGHATDEPPPR